MTTPVPLKWFRSLHYGSEHVCLWWRIWPDGRLHIAAELVKDKGLIADLCVDIRKKTRHLNIETVDYTIAYEAQLIGQVKKTDDGDTRERTFRQHGISLRTATHDPIQGWTRVLELLGTRSDGRPYLTIDPSCVALIRAVTNAVRDPTNEELVLDSPHDQPLSALRIGAMSRPAPHALSPHELPPNAVGRLVEELRTDALPRKRLAWRA